MHGGCQAFQVVAQDVMDFGRDCHGVVDAVEALRSDDDVREDSVQPVVHLGSEARHDAVDHDHRCDTQHYADDGRQRDIPCAQVARGKKKFEHRQSFGLVSIDSLRLILAASLQFAVLVGEDRPMDT